MKVIDNIKSLRDFVLKARNEGKIIGFVPTMGALHEGHLSLVKTALGHCDIVVVSIFVNPTQFGPNEDYDAYPRNLDSDCDKLSGIEGDIVVYAPSIDEMYPDGFSTGITVKGVSDGLCGAARPGHFNGVAVVVTKLLLQVMPDKAFFGEKDFQQLQVIKRFVKDLNINVEIIGVPIVRDKETGLALSSRNAYLSDNERKVAETLNKTLFAMSDKIDSGEKIADVRKWGIEQINKAGFDKIDYLEICDISNLKSVTSKDNRELRILVAARIGKTRLIDNVKA